MKSGSGRTLLKSLLAIALLAWVASGLPWSDTLVYVIEPSDSSTLLEVEGTIHGGWREQQVTFEFDPLADVGGGWPAVVQDAVRGGARLDVERRAQDQAGFEWRPGMPRVFLDLEAQGLVAAFAGLLLGLAFGVTRWWRILHLAGCQSSWWNTLRLSCLGLFFNLVLPGITGGDLPKALMVVRENPGRRADALASVVIDRLVGLWSLVLLACGVIWMTGEGFDVLRLPSAAAFGLLSTAMVLVLLPGPRRVMRMDSLISRLPQAERIKKLEHAALLYRGHGIELVVSVLLSFGNHLSVIAATYAISQAFGSSLDFETLVGVVAVANLITALPLSPGGWGVGEAAFGTLFKLVGSAVSLGVAISVTYRLCTVALGLAGGVFMLWPGTARLSREELEEQP